MRICNICIFFSLKLNENYISHVFGLPRHHTKTLRDYIRFVCKQLSKFIKNIVN